MSHTCEGSPLGSTRSLPCALSACSGPKQVPRARPHGHLPSPCRGRALPPLRTLLIDNHDSFSYNLHQALTVLNAAPPVVVQNDALSWAELKSWLREEAFDNIVVSPGPGTPLSESDLGVVGEVLRACGQVPLLGVCLGFQALAAVHGADVAARDPTHGRLSSVVHTSHPLFAGIPSGFCATRYHSLQVVEASLPPELQPIAWTVGPTHGPQQQQQQLSRRPPLGDGAPTPERVLMGLAHTRRPHYGVQFHPESIATEHGDTLLQNFAALTRQWLARSPHRGGLPSSQPGRRTLAPRRPPPAVAEQGDPPPAAPRSRAEPTLRVAWRRLGGALPQLGGSVALFRHLFGAHLQQNCFFLDSAATDRGRFSYMGGPGGPLWRRLTYRVPARGEQQGRLQVTDSTGRTTSRPARFWEHLEGELGRLRARPVPALPFPFQGGFVGYLGYELKAECGAPSFHTSQFPDAGMFLADRLVVVDAHTDDVYLLALWEAGDAAQEEQAGADLELLEEQVRVLAAGEGTAGGKCHPPLLATGALRPAAFTPRMGSSEYTSAVALCQRALHAGDSYELCLTTAWERTGPLAAPFELYSVLRAINPAPYAAYLSFAGQGAEPGLQVCSSSPERFLRGDAAGRLEASPIKGTARRSRDPRADAAAAAALAASGKDAAENLMIVDLLRNDLGRVCTAGSVHVPRLMEVQSFASVHQLVSTVRGARRPGVSVVDCLRAAFPGGSMTGAPKLRSMQILDRLEGHARGVYSGSIGFLGFNDCFDLNIAIRTAVVGPAGVSVGAGGAVVVQSSPQAEYEEMCLKAERVLEAVAVHEAALPSERGGLPCAGDAGRTREH